MECLHVHTPLHNDTQRYLNSTKKAWWPGCNDTFESRLSTRAFGKLMFFLIESQKVCSSWEEQITTPSPSLFSPLSSCSPDCHPATLTKRGRRLAKGMEQRGEGEQNSVCFGRYLLQTYSDLFSACSTHFFHSLLGEYLHHRRLLAHWAYQVQNGWVGKTAQHLLANMVVTLTCTFCWYMYT